MGYLTGPGTHYWKAPELWTDAARVSPKIDVYAVGIIVYELDV